MYRINSISKQLVKLQVVQNDTVRAVSLLPGNFVFSEKLTDQLKNLQANRCIRIREVAENKAANSSKTATNSTPTTVASTSTASKVTSTSVSEESTADSSKTAKQSKTSEKSDSSSSK